MAAALIESLLRDRPDLVLRIVDLAQAPELAVKYRVMATPAIVIDGRLVFTGVPTPEALRKAVLTRRP